MVETRCGSCRFNPSGGYCEKLKHPLENGEAMLHHGGAIGVYYSGKTYPSRCGIEHNKT